MDALNDLYGAPANKLAPGLNLNIPPELIDEYKAQRGDFDYHLKVNEKSANVIKLHKEVLAQFENFLTDEDGFLQEQATKDRVLINPDERKDPLSSQALQCITDYIYLDKNPLTPKESVEIDKAFVSELIEISRQFGLTDLQKYLEESLEKYK